MSKSKLVQNHLELDVYKAVFQFQQEVFHVSKAFPKEETYSLTDQFRRGSRSVGANIAEAWAKRRHAAHFQSKLTDADGELQETLHWLRTAHCCSCLPKPKSLELATRAEEIGRMLGGMIANHRSFCTAF